MKTSTSISSGLVLALALGAAVQPAAAGGDVVYGSGMRQTVPAAIPVPAPVPVPDEASGFYVRLDASVGFNSADKYSDSIPTLQAFRNDDGLSTFGRYGFGAGYHFSRWLRADITFDGRSSTRSTASQDTTFAGPVDASGHAILMRNTVSDQFRTKDYTALVNGYLDLPMGPSFTPYVGGGVGVVIHDFEKRKATLQNLQCVDTVNCNPAANGLGGPGGIAFNPGYLGLDSFIGGASGRQNSSQLAAALMAGFSYKLSTSGSIDIGWRWLHLSGTAFNTPVTQIVGTTNNTFITTSQISKITIPDQNIQEIRIGYRFDLN